MIQRNFISTLVSILLLTATASVSAVTQYMPSGSNLSYGHSNHGQMVHSYINNPAAAATIDPEKDNKYQFGLVTFGVGLEYGEVDNLFDTVDEQITRLSDTNILSEVTTVQAADNQVAAYIDELNATLTALDKDGYGKAYTTVHLPMTPLVIAADLLGGNWTFDANISAIAQLEVLHQNIVYNGANNPGDVTVDVSGVTAIGDTIPITIDSDSTLLTRAAAVSELALGYSTKVSFGSTENFAVGVRGKYYRVGLAQINQRLGGVLDGSEEIFDALEDADFTDSTDFGIDVGLIWQKPRFQLGASLENINEPSFEFNRLDLSNYKVNGPIAQKLNELITYTMESQLKFEGSVYSENKMAALNLSLDGNAVPDPFGDEYQWLSANLSFNINSWFIPDLRVGYRANLAGTELTYATFGLSVFKALTFDVAYGLEKVELDGTAVPRSFAANLALQMSF